MRGPAGRNGGLCCPFLGLSFSIQGFGHARKFAWHCPLGVGRIKILDAKFVAQVVGTLRGT